MRTQSSYAKLLAAMALAATAAANGATPAATSAAAGDAHATAVAGAGTLISKAASYIVESSTALAARRSVRRVGGTVARNLDIIHGVEAQLNPWQKARLAAVPGVRIYENRAVTTSTSAAETVATATVMTASDMTTLDDGTAVATPTSLYQTDYALETGASTLQAAGTTGKGVTIAVVDTGLWMAAPTQNLASRVLASLDVTVTPSVPVTGDPYGHGTHITSIAAGGAENIAGGYFGIAPNANLVIVRAFDGTGEGTYANVIAGLDWIVANKAKYNIRVLNLSFGATPESWYWNDAVDQAVMAAWQAGIVVVVAAGNSGPSPMTVDVPGNVPYVITVGAITDNNTPYTFTDDSVTSFSSAGPTYEGFVKPDVVAEGGHMVGSMQSTSYLANIDPGSMNAAESLFVMSGTSQAAAVTSGVVALMLQADPSLTPDNVKCRLMASAAPALSAGTLAYSVFQQGAGLINAVAAVNSSGTGCANVGLDISADVAGTAHFGGPANVNSSGTYYIMNMTAASGTPLAGAGLSWSGTLAPGGYDFTEGYVWSQGFTWSNGYPWSNSANWTVDWTNSALTTTGYLWKKSVIDWTAKSTPRATTKRASMTKRVSIVHWVPNE
ncbi:MAG: S8 family peptidase [Steroidobacteraceae bacterium]